MAGAYSTQDRRAGYRVSCPVEKNPPPPKKKEKKEKRPKTPANRVERGSSRPFIFPRSTSTTPFSASLTTVSAGVSHVFSNGLVSFFLDAAENGHRHHTHTHTRTTTSRRVRGRPCFVVAVVVVVEKQRTAVGHWLIGSQKETHNSPRVPFPNSCWLSLTPWLWLQLSEFFFFFTVGQGGRFRDVVGPHAQPDMVAPCRWHTHTRKTHNLHTVSSVVFR